MRLGIGKYVPDAVQRLVDTNVRRTTLPEAAAQLGVPLVSLADSFPRTVFSSPIKVPRGTGIPELPAALPELGCALDLPFDNTLHRDPGLLATQMDTIRQDRQDRLQSGSRWSRHLAGLR